MIALIVAHSRNRVIGKGGRMAWRIPGEQKRYRELTMGHAIVMGRITYEEMNKPLPGRLNIVVSRTKKFEGENLITVSSVEEAIAAAGDKNVYISGGTRIFAEAMPYVETMYITEIDAHVDGDAFFPEFDPNQFDRTVEAHFDGDMPYDYVTYTRKK